MDQQDFEVQVHGKFGVLPVCMEEGSVGYDIALPEDVDLVMPYNSRRVIDTGVIIKPPMKCFELVVPRSSSRKRNVRLSNTVGVIDPSYCGPNDTLHVDITRDSKKLNFVGTFQLPDSQTNVGYSMMLKDFCDEHNVKLYRASECYDPETRTVHVYEKPEDEFVVYRRGQRFCQVLFIPYYRPDLVESKLEEFESENRGGFGSTGQN